MRIALIHDFLNQLGGAEKVLEAFHELYPEALVYTMIHDEKSTKSFFKDWKIKTSYLQSLPFGIKKYKYYLLLMPSAVESFNFDDYDVILSSSSAYAKGAIVKPNSLSICYCHTPTRYLWSDAHTYVQELGQGKLFKKFLPIPLNYLRMWDRLAAERVDNFIANSNFVAKRIKKYYHRESKVIYPPVEVEKFKISPEIDNYFLVISRLRPYKKVELAMQAFYKLGIPLKIIGVGSEKNDKERVKKFIKPNIEFLGYVSEEEKAKYLSRCKALIHPQEEDFGITAVEAMASGRPVIAYKSGGVLETVIDGATGKFFEEQTWECLADAVIKFKAEDFDPVKIREHSLKFSKERFKNEIKEFIENKLKH
ncbi:MAG: group 1 glycosyl transferase [Parcubacteria group bacterium Athens1014_10]|nr:MAG: group 1 glycosyl transferase [Parcubacteria group bacterium Athens1014_10]TSD04883.1 MAG: group 1 glycosyl transferase [Parcubacteria group bacterium Athens0714_12]